MCVDIRTKSLVKSPEKLGLSAERYNMNIFKKEHLKFYKKINPHDEENVEEDLHSDSDVSIVSDGCEFTMDHTSESHVERANALVDEWMKLKINFQDIAKDQDPNLSINIGIKKRSSDGTVRCNFSYEKLYKHIDTLKWWEGNSARFPSLALMARVYLSRELTNSFQERVFPSGGFVNNIRRTTMDVSRAEKLTLGKDNRDLFYTYFK